LLKGKQVGAAQWEEFFRLLMDGRWRLKLYVTLRNYKLRFFVETVGVEATLPNAPEFVFKESDFAPRKAGFCTLGAKFYANFLEMFGGEVCEAKFVVHKTAKGYFAYIVVGDKARLVADVAKFLELDLKKNPRLVVESAPKFLKANKIRRILAPQAKSAILKTEGRELALEKYAFNSHQLIIGGSGTGKSKFIAKLVEQLQKIDGQKVVLIDPHDNLKYDVGALSETEVFRFTNRKNSFRLDFEGGQDIIATTDLTLELLKTLLAEQYNPKLERVLRFSIYLLLEDGTFSFQNLRNLLTEPEYRTEMVGRLTEYLPEAVSRFFLTDFNELKTRSHAEAIAPILALVDELAILSAFKDSEGTERLKNVLAGNFQTVVSLNGNKLGDKAVKMIAGLVLQQVFLLAQAERRPLTLIVDEIAVVENPMVARLLSEGRKFGVTVVLCGQYFSQIDYGLKQAIFANVSNYFVFRVAREDAEILVKYLNVKSDEMGESDVVDKLSALKNRELFARVNIDGEPSEGFLATTLDYVPARVYYEPIFDATEKIRDNILSRRASFDIYGKTTIVEVMDFMSSRRLRSRVLKGVRI